uniref:RNase H domain-containing protein n=1 Tax=Heterorhabditis bacteriophora TaxID=37862 RepID=A0A1I7WFZ3_HETBA
MGMKYNSETDMFQINVKFPKQTALTKRSVISQIHSAYGELINEWNTISASIHGTSMSIPRKIGPTDLNCPVSLWVFVDASTKAYACCWENQINSTKRNITIPRLELVTLLLGIRLAHSIIMSLRKEAIHIRIVGDSKIASSICEKSSKTYYENS